MIGIVYHMLSNVEKEKLVIDLYYNQRKNVLQIAQEARISFEIFFAAGTIGLLYFIIINR
jgi:hypothetical protein